MNGEPDARFEDVGFSDQPLRLAARDADDVAVLSALLQDAVGLIRDIVWMPKARRVAISLNRFRWEDRAKAERAGRGFERVRSALIIEQCLKVRARRMDPQARDRAFSLLSMKYDPAADENACARLMLCFSGASDMVLDIEYLDVRLLDMTRPWAAASKRAPDHE